VCGECIDWEGRQRLLLLANDITELRTADQVREKMRGAERANEAKTEFISRMSHELRTPLNAVLGFAQLLGEPDEPMTARQRSHLQRLHGGALHLQALVDDLIDIASIEAGRLKVAPEPVGLDAILASSIALCAAAAAQARVEVVIEGPHKNALLAMADPTRLRQVLANLVSNGIKYNRPGGHVIVRSEAYGELVVVDVTDDGLGMTDEQQQRLFTPYDRLGREGSGVAGTGIGLVLARQLVELMGGRLEVRSVAGQGTQLRIELPRAEDGESNTGFGSALATAGLEGTGLVLYVEDEPVNRLLVEQALGSCSGVELITAEDGASGLALARERRPDLVLLDMHLPDMNGLQVMSALRGHPATSGIPVVMLSASALAPDIDFARASGAVEYWTKPIDIKKLRAGVRRLIGVDL
jgi:CheY-like chemotaxis protein